jgi:hypothetical protein
LEQAGRDGRKVPRSLVLRPGEVFAAPAGVI